MAKPHPTVDRVVAILESISAAPNGLTVSALARLIGVPKSTAHTLVQGLLATDFLEERSGLLALGPGVELLASARGGHQLRRLARDELMTLASNTEETAHLSIRSGDHVILIDQVESPQPIKYAVPLRVPRPLLTTATGKLFLADLDADELEDFLAAHGESKSVGAKRIRAQRDEIRRTGVSYNDEESIAGVCTIAAAVRTGTDELVAGMVVAGPSERVRPKLGRIEPMLRDAAMRLSQQLR
ncbi:IclR family transcriptional regulator [Mycobacterium sp. AT1]|uniref:IclR family transcriptional regulator n=1 Tax=Mycobacterium sp. AT1 TaxID=1961706 RepID=UPI0009D0304F|nr:IclR family transcriptional regulator [Mycobacterium sp. AT1]OPX11771.1 hypothetical protein B1790_06275 [Mycobacterium sp. AT1]